MSYGGLDVAVPGIALLALGVDRAGTMLAEAS